MKVIYTQTASRQIESQIAYLVSRDAHAAAVRARRRIESFITDFLIHHPRAGKHIPDKGIYEFWIPRTRYVLMYRIEPKNVLRILALYHTSQDRSGFDPDPAG
jgi:plasmid stabilization system protein ParE